MLIICYTSLLHVFQSFSKENGSSALLLILVVLFIADASYLFRNCRVADWHHAKDIALCTLFCQLSKDMARPWGPEAAPPAGRKVLCIFGEPGQQYTCGFCQHRLPKCIGNVIEIFYCTKGRYYAEIVFPAIVIASEAIVYMYI